MAFEYYHFNGIPCNGYKGREKLIIDWSFQQATCMPTSLEKEWNLESATRSGLAMQI